MFQKTKLMLVSLLLLTALLLSPGVGCSLTNQSSPNSASDLAKLEEAWRFILEDYVDRNNIDTVRLSEAAIRAMVTELDDPYTSYLDVETYKLHQSNLEGSFDGIGASVALRDEKITVTAPIPESPAERAGIKAGDIILEIDGRSAEDLSLTEAVLYIRGPKGTTVTLLVLHEDDTTPEEISIVRDVITLVSVRSEMRGDIAYININRFTETTASELTEALIELDRATASGIVLDMRSNPGGLLQAVIDVASHFLESGIVIDVVDNRGKHTISEVRSKEVTTDLPIVVLVDNFSASGSEVLAGALRDNNRATIAGSQTFGKGSVNILRRFRDGSGIYITTSRWLTPSGQLIEGEGITPDYELELEGEEAIQWAIDFLKSNKTGQANIAVINYG